MYTAITPCTTHIQCITATETADWWSSGRLWKSDQIWLGNLEYSKFPKGGGGTLPPSLSPPSQGWAGRLRAWPGMTGQGPSQARPSQASTHMHGALFTYAYMAYTAVKCSAIQDFREIVVWHRCDRGDPGYLAKISIKASLQAG